MLPAVFFIFKSTEMKYYRFNNIKPKPKKSTNKFRHRWIDQGREKDGHDTYLYKCKKCGFHRIKASMFSHSYYDTEMKPLGSTAPDCVF